jgi:hypothetical protein
MLLKGLSILLLATLMCVRLLVLVRLLVFMVATKW